MIILGGQSTANLNKGAIRTMLIDQRPLQVLLSKPVLTESEKWSSEEGSEGSEGGKKVVSGSAGWRSESWGGGQVPCIPRHYL